MVLTLETFILIGMKSNSWELAKDDCCPEYMNSGLNSHFTQQITDALLLVTAFFKLIKSNFWLKLNRMLKDLLSLLFSSKRKKL